jgi:8-oxo-dGTP pyrophosphatase MutT (NUDIX family)
MKPLPEAIREALKGNLPGTGVQWEMASSDRMIKDFPRVKKRDSRLAAVLILIYPRNNSLNTILIQRPNYDGVHSGQISFPGGKAEESDSDIVHTALREASEETGIDPQGVTLLGCLTPLYIPVSDTEVTPVVGWSNSKPHITIDPAEVVHIIEANLHQLADSSIIKVKPFPVRNEMVEVKYYDYNGHIIWGATAMLLHELLTIFRRSGISFTL